MGKKFMGLGGTDHFWDRAKAWILNQITSAVAAKIAEVVANAPEDLDTLKEIADWISAHADSASAMNTQITENKNNIAANSSSISAMNTQIADKQDFRIFNSLEEFNEKKGTSLTVVSGIDNMKDIVNAMSNGEMLIIITKYETGSEVYFGLDISTGWTKMFTFIKSNGLCDVECRTTAPLTIKRVLNFDGVVGDWQELATMDKVVQCVENKRPNEKTVSFELNDAQCNCGTIYGNNNNGGNFKYDYYVTSGHIELVKRDGYGPQGSITASLSGTTLTLTAGINSSIKTITIIKT